MTPEKPRREIDWLVAGPPVSRVRTLRWRVGWACLAVVLLLITGLSVYRSSNERQLLPTPNRTLQESPPPQPTLPMVIELGHRLLGTRTPWSFYGRTSRVLVRVEPAVGRITLTPLPALASGGPVSFVLTAGPSSPPSPWRYQAAVVRPLDFVPGYEVPDGQPARELPSPLASHGPVLPGPSEDQLWTVVGDSDAQYLALVRLDGSAVGRRLPLPGGNVMGVRGDGAGALVRTGPDGVYVATTTSWRKVTSGRLVAVGPGRVLIGRCSAGSCRLAVHSLTGPAVQPAGTVTDAVATDGVISANGRYAALLGPPASSGRTVRIVDLRRQRVVGLPTRVVGDRSALAWAPGARWLLALTTRGLGVFDPATGRETRLGVDLPPMTQLAVRS